MKKYIAAIYDCFLQNANKSKEHEYKFYRWVNTREIANKLQLPISKARYELNKLEKQQKLTSKREPGNYVKWTISFPGFILPSPNSNYLKLDNTQWSKITGNRHISNNKINNNTLLKFDNGEIHRYESEWPCELVTHINIPIK